MKALIFDMGGVLVDLDMEACKKAFKEDLGFDEIDQLLDPCHQKGAIGDMESGAISADEFRDYVISRSRPGVVADDVDQAFYKILVGVEPYKFDLLRRLSKNYDIYMLSNNNPIAARMASEIFAEGGFSMETSFKKCYLSYQMKTVKPSEEFYKAVIADIGLPAEEMLFIDDSKANVQASIDAGLPAVWYEPGTDLAQTLASFCQ